MVSHQVLRIPTDITHEHLRIPTDIYSNENYWTLPGALRNNGRGKGSGPARLVSFCLVFPFNDGACVVVWVVGTLTHSFEWPFV